MLRTITNEAEPSVQEGTNTAVTISLSDQTVAADAAPVIGRVSGRLDRYVSPVERFLARVNRTDQCWEFLRGGTRGSRGQYPAMMVNKTMVSVHRFSYELFIGPIPDGMTIDHKCANTRCVRPDHLEAVSSQENVRRHYREQRTMCRNGLHDISESILVMPWKSGPRAGRQIMRCQPCFIEGKERRKRRR